MLCVCIYVGNVDVSVCESALYDCVFLSVPDICIMYIYQLGYTNLSTVNALLLYAVYANIICVLVSCRPVRTYNTQRYVKY